MKKRLFCVWNWNSDYKSHFADFGRRTKFGWMKKNRIQKLIGKVPFFKRRKNWKDNRYNKKKWKKWGSIKEFAQNAVCAVLEK